ncbi:nitrogen fixation protein FixH [Limnohabitans sp.]|jgi:hypothetical protein|uniref:nitrogen fixation protein FixH n=1 Tax=Limnohabitans sp. TaxID=1907725 RepID=UPI0037C023C6
MSNALQNPREGLPWWRFGLVWMVFGGPAVVVVAGFSTLYIAIVNPDPVIKATPRTAMQERQGITHVPAMQGRNHAATGELPADADAPESLAENAPQPVPPKP